MSREWGASLGPVFRIRRLASTTKGLFRNAEFLRRVLEPRVGAGQVVWHKPVGPSRDLVDDFGRHAGELLREVLNPVRAADQRLFEIDGIVHDADNRHHFSMTDDVLDDDRAVAGMHAASL